MEKREKSGYTFGYTSESTKCNQEGFSERLKMARKDINLSQKDLAKKVGVSTFSIQQYERGNFPKGDNLIALAEALDCSTDWLLTGVVHIPTEAIAGGGKTEAAASVINHKRLQRSQRSQRPQRAAQNEPIQKGANDASPANNNIYQHAEHGQETPKKHQPVSELITKTLEILESDTVYSEALSANIQAFHEATIMHGEVRDMRRGQDEIREELNELKRELHELRKENAELKNDQGESDDSQDDQDPNKPFEFF